MNSLELITSTVISSKMRCSNSKVLLAAIALGILPASHHSPNGFIMQGFNKEQERRIVNFLKNKPVTDREKKRKEAVVLMAGGMGTLKALKQVGLAWSSYQYKPRHKKPKDNNGLLSTPELAQKLGGYNVGYTRKILVELLKETPARIEKVGSKRQIFFWSLNQFKKAEKFLKNKTHTWLQI